MTRQGDPATAASAAAALVPLAVFAGLFTSPTWLPALAELGARIGEVVFG